MREQARLAMVGSGEIVGRPVMPNGIDRAEIIKWLPPAVTALPPTASTCHFLPRFDSFSSHLGWSFCRRKNETLRERQAMSLAGGRLWHAGCLDRTDIRSVLRDLFSENEAKGSLEPATACHIEFGLVIEERSRGLRSGRQVETASVVDVRDSAEELWRQALVAGVDPVDMEVHGLPEGGKTVTFQIEQSQTCANRRRRFFGRGFSEAGKLAPNREPIDDRLATAADRTATCGDKTDRIWASEWGAGDTVCKTGEQPASAHGAPKDTIGERLTPILNQGNAEARHHRERAGSALRDRKGSETTT